MSGGAVHATFISAMPQPIIAFSKDWDDNPTSNHHVLRELAKTRRVLWLNSVATRTPRLSSKRDIRRIVSKLRDFARGPVNVENDLWVFTPLVLPLPHSTVARAVNRLILRASVRLLRARLRLRDFQLWTFLPSVPDYIGTLGESLAVYYCVDEWSLFSYIDTDGMVDTERALLERVDCVFAVNEPLAARKRSVNPETHVASHGVDQPLFGTALEPETAIPADIAALPRPVIGFVGTLQDWVDFELITEVSRRHPEWSIVLVGRLLIDPEPIARLPNVHVLGPRPYDQLAAYCKGFSVGIVPYRISDQLPYRNPLKLREYLSAGLPVVCTALPEADQYDRWCWTATDADGFVRALESAIDSDTPSLRTERSRAMESESWQARVADISRVVDRVAARRQQRTDKALTEATT
jgi:glycosyltransferase involved in cell wall biosynthesis